MDNERKFKVCLISLILLLVTVLLISLFIGSYNTDLIGSVLYGDKLSNTVIFKIRLPRIIFASIVGGTLAICGASLQALYRNSLASPFTLGVSGGASFGALLAIKIGLFHSFLGFSFVSISAFLFSILTMLAIYNISKVNGIVSTGKLLLAGVVANFLYSSFILFIQFFSNFTESLQTLRWIMGSLDIVGYNEIINSLIFVIPSIIILISTSKDLNVFSLGDDVANSLGVDIKKMERKIYIATSLSIGAVISISGPIGFVGLIIPHILRLIVGADNRILVPCSFLLGASFLTIADTISRTIISPVEIPVGILTACIGGIFFLWLLVKHQNDIFI
ncbi:MAG: iron ABC transporter permease [Thermodesulfobacteriota bacterium]